MPCASHSWFHKAVFFFKVSVNICAEIAQMALDSVESTHSEVLSTVKVSGIDCDSVIIEFIGKNGKVLASKEFK